MGRTPTSPIPLNPLILRYLEDIEAEHQKRLEDKTIEPHEMFLVHTLLEGETYPNEHSEALVAFKRYFSKEKTLNFPSLREFAEKYKFNWKTEDVMESGKTDRYTSVSFEKFFPVKVTNFKKVGAFRKKYGKPSAKTIERPVPKNVTQYSLVTKTLSKEGVRPHDFRLSKYQRKTDTLRVFESLWENRKHIRKNGVPKQGDPQSFDNFALQTNLARSREELTLANIRKLQGRVRSIIKSLTRQGFSSLDLECTRNRILLTVTDR